MVPYWDFQAPDIPLARRGTLRPPLSHPRACSTWRRRPRRQHRARYAAAARATLASLASHAYSSFDAIPAVLLHGTYSWREAVNDRGLAYGDTFFLEALLRLRRFPPDVGRAPARQGREPPSGSPQARSTADLGSVWASRGRKCLDLRIAGTQEVGAVRVALLRGDEPSRGSAHPGLDGRPALEARPRQTMTSGETAGYETLDFAPRAARWGTSLCRGTTLGVSQPDS